MTQRPAGRAALAVAVGLAVGVLTSIGQTYLDGPLNALVNSASAWLVSPFRGLGGAVLAAAFLAEGLWVYLHELHYRGTAALWLAMGAAIAVVLVRPRRELAWLALTLPAGLIAEIALSRIYAQSF